MNRLDLYRQLWSVLPHCGGQWPTVGLHMIGATSHVWASDGYTIGITRKPTDIQYVTCYLPKSEALDLARALRPKNKAQEAEAVQLVYVHTNDDEPDELHVNVEGVLNIKDGGSSAIYETTDDKTISLSYLLDKVIEVNGWPSSDGPQALNPDLYGRLADAKHDELDYVTFWPKTTPSGKIGAGVVVVGDSFIGVCLGLLRPPAVETLRSFLGDEAAAA